MAEKSLIEWTDATWNPWIGCTKVSHGCKHCYAETLMDHRYSRVKWGPAGTRQRTSDANWKKPIQWNKRAEKEGQRVKVFCASLADVFEDNDQLIDWRIDLWDLIKATPNLDWLLLTKRPENVKKMTEFIFRQGQRWQLPANIWLGTSVEDQETADFRIPELLKIPAQIRFLSCEPLLGPLDLSKYLMHAARLRRNIDWVIAGGESGPGARPTHPNWVRSLRDQSQAAGVAFFFKQWGQYAPETQVDQDLCPTHPKGLRPLIESGKVMTLDGDLMFWQVGKKAAGHILDGVTWQQFPQTEPIQ